MLSKALLLFFIIDPFGNVPLFVAILGKVPRERRGRVLARELAIALVALLAFLLGGRYLLAMLHISEPALAIAGAVVLFLISLPMIFPSIKLSMEAEGSAEPFVVPLAIPLFVGPSAIAMVMLLGSGHDGALAESVGAVVLAWLAASIVLALGNQIAARLGKRGMVALERLMGMLLVAVSVELLLSGISKYEQLAAVAP